jgi:hypothetical protein
MPAAPTELSRRNGENGQPSSLPPWIAGRTVAAVLAGSPHDRHVHRRGCRRQHARPKALASDAPPRYWRASRAVPSVVGLAAGDPAAPRPLHAAGRQRPFGASHACNARSSPESAHTGGRVGDEAPGRGWANIVWVSVSGLPRAGCGRRSLTGTVPKRWFLDHGCTTPWTARPHWPDLNRHAGDGHRA